MMNVPTKPANPEYKSPEQPPKIGEVRMIYGKLAVCTAFRVRINTRGERKIESDWSFGNPPNGYVTDFQKNFIEL